MDFYDDSLGQGERPVAALHASSWPPTATLLQQYRSNSRALCKLSSIPELSEQQEEMIKAALKTPASNQDRDDGDAASSTHSDSDMFGAFHGISGSFLEPQLGDGQQEHSIVPATSDLQEDMHQQSIRSRRGESRDSGASSPDDQGGDAADLTAAAATTWVTNIRHFTDCMPIAPDSVCSSSTYCSLMVVKDSISTDVCSHQQQQEDQSRFLHPVSPMQQQQQFRSYFLPGTAALPCSLPNSSSSASLVPTDDAAAAGEAAVQASLLEALHELDELEFLPFDRVAQWLETQAAAGVSISSFAAATSGDDAVAQSPRQQRQQQQLPGINLTRQLSSSGSELAGSSKKPTAGSRQQKQQHAQDEALFDAPDWWQEAVLARLQQQREAFQGSWWSRARVLASLAAQKAACALQV